MSMHINRRAGVVIKLAVLNLAFAMLGACGGGGDSNDVVAPPAPTPAPAPTPPAPAALTVDRLLPNMQTETVLQDTQRVNGVLNGNAFPAPIYPVADTALPNLAALWQFDEGPFSGQDGQGRAGGHRSPKYPVALQRDGTVTYLDQVGKQVVRVKPSGEVSTQTSLGRADGAAAQGFWLPSAFAVDKAGNAFVADGWYAPLDVVFTGMSSSGNPMGPGAWPGIWKVSGDQITRLTGVVAGDAMVDGDRDTAQFTSIAQMVAGDDGFVYVIDVKRVVVTPSATPSEVGYKWRGYALRRIDSEGRVNTLRTWEPEDYYGTALTKRLDGRVVLVMSLAFGVMEYDVVSGHVQPVNSGAFEQTNHIGWRNSVDSADNTWLMSTFVMYPPATGLSDNLRMLTVTRYGADGEFRPGSLQMQWGCDTTGVGYQPLVYRQEVYAGAACRFMQLGVANDQLVALLNNNIVRIDLPALLPRQ